MRLVWKEILEGWRNDLFPSDKLRDIIRTTQEERLAICKDCPFNSSRGKINILSHCTDCGCPLQKKSACLSCECPKKKWIAVISKKDDQDIDNQLNR